MSETAMSDEQDGLVRGYRTVRAREDWAVHQLLGIWTLYAMRP